MDWDEFGGWHIKDEVHINWQPRWHEKRQWLGSFVYTWCKHSFVLTQMSQFLQNQKQAFYVHQQLWLGIQSSWGFSPIDAIS